ncbi:hypothetical protein ES319_D07G228700v1 [Gossypium barbadense]|uniref:RING-type domain-containing protein n=2 Tax=Gossypium TaxID=3633 RepID=A0A5J5QXW0_GOSBA|nr:hypothetical protein ES319_D07G228700v1 [Gossypium barbadense]PPD77661.1 hypothetical protein GOBAR_DD25398 [Gossypium barbadense]TYG62614.1 hypothetical protein ES288_D07G245800v1 [Gossypium darwinii]
MEGGNRRRLTLFEQISAVENGRDALAGLTLDAVLGNAKRPEQPPAQNRTLLEIIRDDGSNKEKKSWKALRDKLRLKRLAVSARTSSVRIPASDVIVNDNNRSQFSRQGSFRSHSADPTGVEDRGGSAPVSDPTVMNSRPQLARFGSGRFVQDHESEISRQHLTPFPSSNNARNNADSSEDDDDDSPVARDETRRLGAALEEERALSAREAAAAQEAATVAETNARPIGSTEEPLRMSLMDFLEETERQMGLTGSKCTTGDADADDEENEEKDKAEGSGGMEQTCCVCMVRHKGAAFIPCGHTFCRLCSRELWVQRGNCPLCNGTIQEILDIF